MRREQALNAVCLIAGGMNSRQYRLQPWRYLHEVAHQLWRRGHQVTVITDGKAEDTAVFDVPYYRLTTISNPHWRPNKELAHTITALQPDIVLWHMGLTSFLHQRFAPGLQVPVVGIFTSPIYQMADLTRIGARRVVSKRQLSGIHTIGTLLPNQILGHVAARSKCLQHIVVQTATTREQLAQTQITDLPISVIKPGVDAVWEADSSAAAATLREKLGYTEKDIVVLYFGSPSPLRGLHTLIKAVQAARAAVPTLKLLILSRRHADELLAEDAELNQLLSAEGMTQQCQIMTGYLPPETLAAHISLADIVALPFELVPSDAPLSLLEAKTLGKPVVTTKLACLPELVADSPHYLALPANVESLAQALLQAVRERPLNKQTSNPPIRQWPQVGEEWSQLIQKI